MFILSIRWPRLVTDVAAQLSQSVLDFPNDAPRVTCGIIADATRLGNPAKDFRATFMWKDDGPKSTWLPVQETPSAHHFDQDMEAVVGSRRLVK